MRRAPALPFEAFKFTGNTQPHPTIADATAPTASPKITKIEKPAPPTNTNPSSSAQPPTSTTTTNTSSAVGVPLELFGDLPLKLIIVGHNPSEIAWKRRHFYANPSNWMWKILKDTHLAPVDIVSGCTEDYKMPADLGIGFTDVGSGCPGTDSNQFKAKHFDEWRQPFYDRLEAQMKRASKHVENCTCGTCGAPIIVAFSGKKQFAELFRGKATTSGAGGGGAGRKRKITSNNNSEDNNKEETRSVRIQAVKPTSIPLGRQSILPLGWPLPVDKTEVWVMTSTSGAAAMTKEARYAIWQQLAERLEREPWQGQIVNRKATCSF